jgi:hypothetical protein
MLVAYLRERYPATRYVPLAAALAYVSGASARDLLPVGAATWILLAALRLRDDLADLPKDRRVHPNRWLSRVRDSKRLRRLHLLALLGAVASFAPLSGSRSLVNFILLLLLVGALEIAYLLRVPGKTHWVLLKYPLLLAILRSSPRQTEGVQSSGLVASAHELLRALTGHAVHYMAALILSSIVVFEWSDDPELQRDRRAPWVIGLGSLAALSFGGGYLVEAGVSGPVSAAIVGVFSAAGLWVVAHAGSRTSPRLELDLHASRLTQAGRRLALHSAALAICIATCRRLMGGVDV